MTGRQDLLSVICMTKYVSALESDDKKKRKRNLEELRTVLIDDDSGSFEDKVASVYKQVLRCFCDPAESCREQAILLIGDVLKKIRDDNDAYFPFILPIMVQRLGNPEIVETSEEVRLLLVELCHFIVKKFPKCITHYVEEIVQILLKTLNDPHPKIKKESCDCVADLSQAVPRQLFTYTAVILKPIMENFKHQHSRVRVSAIEAVGEVLRRGDSNAVENALVPLAERLFDQAPSVRGAAVRVAATWMLHMPDRYSFFARFIPLLFTGFHDIVPEIRDMSLKMWEDIGKQYLEENREDLKDKIDFPMEINTTYYSSVGSTCPSLGCRALASRFLHWFVPVLAAELRDWRADVRLRAAQLVLSLAEHAQARSTHYVPALADALSGACDDDDERVACAAQAAAVALGAFVSPAAWAPLLVPSPADPPPAAGRLLLLAGLVRGAAPLAIAPLLPRLARRLCAEDVRDAREGRRRGAALRALGALLEKARDADGRPWRRDAKAADSAVDLSEDAKEDTKEDAEGDAGGAGEEGSSASASRSSLEDWGVDVEGEEGLEGEWVLDAVEPLLFRALLTLQATADDDHSSEALSEELLLRLGGSRGGLAALWARRLPPLLRSLRAGCRAWGAASADRRVLERVLRDAARETRAAAALAPALAEAAALVAECAGADQPPEASARALTLLAAALGALAAGKGAGAGAARAEAARCAAQLVRGALQPALVWRAGRAQEAVRAAASACLLALLSALPEQQADGGCGAELRGALGPLAPLLSSLGEDTCRSVRLYSLRALPLLLPLLKPLAPWGDVGDAGDGGGAHERASLQHVANALQAALRRLDDVDDAVRLAALRCVGPLLGALVAAGAAGARGQADAAFDSLLVHLDDPSAAFRGRVKETLSGAGELFPTLLREKLRAERHKFRHPHEAEALLSHLDHAATQLPTE